MNKDLILFILGMIGLFAVTSLFIYIFFISTRCHECGKSYDFDIYDKCKNCHAVNKRVAFTRIAHWFSALLVILLIIEIIYNLIVYLF